MAAAKKKTKTKTTEKTTPAKAATVEKALTQAHAALSAATAADDEAGLDALLVAWRQCRIARIADLIDRVSERVTEQRGGAVKGKTVKERTKQFIALAKKKESADVGRLIATPLPGTWRDALPVMNELVKLPDDPRIAMGLARIVEAAQFDTWTSSGFYRVVFASFDAQEDLRTLPILKKAIEHEKSRYWRRSTGRLELSAIQNLERIAKSPPKLLASEEAALAKVESLFASTALEEKTLAKGEAGFLAAIYEAPDDDAGREVFADWLTEHGDPRGEFISIQLAHHAGRIGDASRKREASLLKKHAKAWIGPIEDLLTQQGRVFERGFLASAGILSTSSDKPPSPTFAHPSWATLHSIELSGSARDAEHGAQIFALPSMQWLRAVRRADEATLAAILSGPPRPRIEEVDFILDRENDEYDEDALKEQRKANRAVIVEKCSATFPNAKRLTLDGEIAKADWILGTDLAKRVERLTLNHRDYDLMGTIEALNRYRLLAIKELVFLYHHGHEYPDKGRSNWHFTVTRDDNHRFTKVHGESDGASSLPSRYTLEQLLQTLEPNDLTELTIDRERVCSYDEGDILALETRLKTFTTLKHVDVPWDRLDDDTARKDTKESDARRTVRIQLFAKSGKVSAPKDVARILAMVSEAPLSLTFDSYAVNHGKHTPFPSGIDMAEHTCEVLQKERTHSVKLYRKGASELSSITLSPFKPRKWRTEGQDRIDITSAWSDEPGFVDRYLDWLVRLVTTFKIETGTSDFHSLNEPSDVRPPRVNAGAAVEGEEEDDDDDDRYDDRYDSLTLEPFRNSPRLHWIVILNAATHAKHVPFAALEKLGEGDARLRSLRVIRTESNLILLASPKPNQRPTEEWQDAYQIAVCNVMWKDYERAWNIDPRDLVLQTLGEALEKHGFTRTRRSPLNDAVGKISYIARHSSGARAVDITLADPIDKMAIEVQLRQAVGKMDADLSEELRDQRYFWPRSETGYEDPAATSEKQARKSLTAMVSAVNKLYMPWFEHPEKDEEDRKRRRRRR